MGRFYYFLFIFIAVLLYAGASGQDTLPKFSVRNIGKNRIIIGWVNNYPLTKQISIQNSLDSLKNYKTILSVADPNTRENGFADTKAANGHMFYRLFVVLDKGQFYFTAAKQPAMDTVVALSVRTIKNDQITREKDSSVQAPITAIVPKRPDFIPSFFVYTNKEGYIFLSLPDAETKKYHLRFFEADDTFLFEIKNIKQTALTLDKTNFLHSGWFKFELYGDDKLIEKNKVYLPREF
ncbi:MAG: hypothetical protein NVSMB67_07420 [Flavisolibacter sp.]